MGGCGEIWSVGGRVWEGDMWECVSVGEEEEKDCDSLSVLQFLPRGTSLKQICDTVRELRQYQL